MLIAFHIFLEGLPGILLSILHISSFYPYNRPRRQVLLFPTYYPLLFLPTCSGITKLKVQSQSSSKGLPDSTWGSHFSSVTQSCLTLCDPMNRSMPGLPVHHQLSEFTQTHGDGFCDAIQPSHPLSSPSPPALNLSQHQGLFQ